ncbi:deaminase domain-containing protein [Capnocytophaga felis]|uniref:Fibronectin type-III domain-containing protein n=1 Tax=Capnocytophaga felis TaxID=2267611 RepID=A0A5M4BAA3_9FLAO|nr:deaminase domain-containing protein [Capnocytophaga felis]GET46533.1 hypothetical protein RCZ01_18350 [Capnocytophaga felis]GET49007.1 hypothetical protein RCZ02_18380 [Capnocytophaga felis]
MRYIKYVILVWIVIQSCFLKAQQYPVDVQLFVTPPYQQSLRDYWATFEPKMQVYLLLKDLNSPVRNVALRFSLEDMQGQPLAQTASYASPFQTQLTSGVRKNFSNIDLKSLLAFENLQGVSENFYNDLLPEGAYFFCLTAYDLATQMPLSAKARTLIQIRRYTPPLPTLPAQGEVIAKQSQFQHLVFQWMLRDPAPFTQYEFTLKEVWDNSLNPEEAFISGRLVYQGKVPSNTILYGTDKPILLENKRYVWKVRAFTQNPNNPNQRQSFFHNNGESEAFYFDYVSHCEAPKFLTAITKDNTANIRWSGEPVRANTHSGENGGLYKILYREKGKNWKSQMSNHPQATLTGLKRGKNYIYKVGIACGLGKAMGNVFGEQTYLYSAEQEFVTPHKQNDSTSVQCGVKPEIRIKNRELLQEVLGVNETFMAGDFPVTVLRATGSNGVFSGEGYVQVPYLLDTKIKVKFDEIKINSERQLFEGKLVTTYDKTEQNIFEVPTSDFFEKWFTINKKIGKIIHDGIIDSIEIQSFKNLVKQEKDIFYQIPNTEENQDILNILQEKNEVNTSFTTDYLENHSLEKEIAIPNNVVEANKKANDVIKVTIISEEGFEKSVGNEIFIPSYSGIPIKFIEKTSGIKLDHRGSVVSFKINDQVYVATISLNKFYGYFQYEIVDSLAQNGKKFILTEEINQFLQKKKFKNYTIARHNDSVISFAKRIEGKAIALDCLCEYSWKQENTPKSIEITFNSNKNVIPENAITENCQGVACETPIKNGLGTIIFVALTNDNTLKKYWQDTKNLKQLETLKQYLDQKTHEKTYAIYDPESILDKQAQGSNSAYIQFFKKNKIYNLDDFKKILKYETSSRDVPVIFSTVDLWQDIPKSYNAHSKDFHRKNGHKYEYSFADLTIRYRYVFLMSNGNQTITRVIKQREREGIAEAISTHDGYEQYVGKYGTDSAIFFWMENYFIEVADPVQLTQAAKIVRSFLKTGDDIVKFSKKSLANKKVVNELFEKWQKNKNNLPDDFVKEQDRIWREAGFKGGGKPIVEDVDKVINKVPTQLVEGKNIFRGFVADYSKAKSLFKKFRENKIYELKKQFSGAKLLEEIQKFNRKNLAYFEGKIEGFDFKSSDIKISGNKYKGEKIFESYKVNKQGGIDAEGAWSREFDTEYVGLSEIAKKLGGKKGQVFENIKGEITIASELPYCVSCQGVIQDFANMFPNVKINLVDGVK